MNITINNFKAVFGITYEEALMLIKNHDLTLSRKYYRACCMAQALEAKKYLEENFYIGKKTDREILESNNTVVFTSPMPSKKIVIK